ncbi:uncharacterized protein LOC127260035 [Andrographis paniculata]|uniref:uncharacterized protein LOC127260035 n=1 Tax=Andrographis paniculata TaxID=175694 RepID=UPI0021E921D9|nr:uncharacterized protein LOC127260035 [Andrographis paniculata]
MVRPPVTFEYKCFIFAFLDSRNWSEASPFDSVDSPSANHRSVPFLLHLFFYRNCCWNLLNPRTRKSNSRSFFPSFSAAEMRNRAPVAIGGVGKDFWLHRQGSGREFSLPSVGSEHDLGAMVRDFIEIGSAGGGESWCSSDGDSDFSDLAYLRDKISLYKNSDDQYESDLRMVVGSIALSITETETNQVEESHLCNSMPRCILYSMATLLQSSGYDAAICATNWHGSSKVPGGEHEFIDIVARNKRYIIDIDFRAHFQIARAVKPYDAVLQSLPLIFVGTITKLKQLLEIMVEAARYSLDQNSMPLPPWRCLPYLEAKWESPCRRMLGIPAHTCSSCVGLLRRLRSFVEPEFWKDGYKLH